MKTFNYESNCVRYKDCYFDISEYENGNISLAIYGYVENGNIVSHISNATVDVEEELEENQIVIDTYSNTNLISFLLDLGIVKKIVRRTIVKFMRLPVVEIDIDELKQYCFIREELRYAS